MSAKALVKPLCQAFQLYNGKDSILVYVREGRISKRVGSFEGTGIQPVLLPIRRSSVRGHQTTRDMAWVIQARYRILRSRSLRDQEYMKTASGRAVSALQLLCDANKTQKPSRRVFLEFAAVMFTEGLELYLLLDTVETSIRDAQELAEKLNVIERYGADLDNYEQRLYSESWGLFSMEGPNAFNLETVEFKNQCKNGLKIIKSLSDQVSAFIQTLQKPPEPPKKANKKNAQNKAPKAESKSGLEPKDKPKDGPEDTPKDTPKDGLNDDVKTGEPRRPGPDQSNPEVSKGKGKDDEGKGTRGGKTERDEMELKAPLPNQPSENQKGKSKALDEGQRKGDKEEPIAKQKGGGKRPKGGQR